VVRRRPKLTVYLRDYPEDYRKYHETNDFGFINPNKLQTWIVFAKESVSARGKSFEELIEGKLQLRGIRIKSMPEPGPKKVALSEQEIIWLKIEAIKRGVPPSIVDKLLEVKR